MGEGTNIDSLQIEISATSTDATEKVNNLVASLIELKDVLKGGFGKVPNVFGDGGKTAGGTRKTGAGVDGLSKKLKSLNSIKLKLAEQIDKARVNIELADKQIDKMVKDISGMDITNGLAKSAGDAIQDFSGKVGNAKDVLTILEDKLESVRDYKPDLTQPNAKEEIRDYIQWVEHLISEYKGAQFAVTEFGKAAKTALSEASKAAKTTSETQKETSEEAKESSNNFKKMKDSLKPLESVKLSIANQLKRAQNEALKTDDTIEKIKQSIKSMREAGPFQIETEGAIDNARNALSGLESSYKHLKVAMSDLKDINAEILEKSFDTSTQEGLAEVEEYSKAATDALHKYKDALENVKITSEKASTTLSLAKTNVAAEKEIGKSDAEKIKRIRDSVKSLNSMKLTLEDKLKSAELQAVKTDGRIEDMRRKLESAKNTENIGEEAQKSIQNAEAKMNEFANAANEAKEKVSALRSKLDTLRSYTPDFSKAGTFQEIEESRTELNDLIKDYKDAQAAVQLYGEQAKNAMAEVTAATRQAAKATKDYGPGTIPKIPGTGQVEPRTVVGPDNSRIENMAGILERIYQYIMKQESAWTALWEKLSPQIDKAKSKLSEFAESIKKKFAEVKNSVSETVSGALEKVADTKAFGLLSKGVFTVLQPIAAASKGIGKAIGTVGSAIGKGVAGIGKLSIAVKAFAASNPYLMVALKALKIVLGGLYKSMQKFAQSSVKAAKTGLDLLAGAADKAKEALTGLKNVLLSIGGKALGAIASGAKSAGKSIVDRFTKPFTNAIKTFKEWKGAIGRIAAYRAIRSAVKAVTDGFKTGINNLYEYSRLVGTEFAPAMDRLATSAMYLKNSLGAMAAPLIQALAPAIDFIIDKFVALLNVIGKVFAVLTGKDVYTQAKRHAVEYGDAAKKANKATKDFVLGIDELNIINDAASDASSAADDFGSMFEEVEIGSDFDWVREIKEAIENGKWGEAGKLLAKKINEIIDAWDSYEWGRKLGEKLKHGLEFAYGFLKEFDFRRLGQKIGDLILGIMDGLGMEGFELIGRTLAAEVNGVFEFLAGLLDSWEPRVADMGRYIAAAINGWFDEIDWAGIAETISRGIIFIANLFKETFKNIEWENIGADFAEFLNNINWYGIITSVADAIIEGFNGLKRLIDMFLAKWNWKDTANQIYMAINESITKIDAFGWGKTLGDVFARAFNFLKEAIAGINWYEIGEKISHFILGFDFVKSLGSLADLLAAGINSAILALQGFLDNILPQAFDIARGIAERIKIAVMSVEWSSLGVAIGDGIKAALSFVAGLLDPETFYQIGKAIGDFLVNIDWPGVFESLANAIVNGIGSAMALVKGLLSSVQPKLESIAKEIAKKINDFVKRVDWKDLGKTIHDGIKAALDFLETILDNLDWESIGQAIVDFLSELKWGELLAQWGDVVGKAIGGALKSIDLSDAVSLGWDIVSGLIAGMLNKFAESGGIFGWIKRIIFNPFINGFKSLFGIHSPSTVMAELGGFLIEGLAEGISNTWHTITDFFNEALETLKTFLSDTWENISETASAAWEGIREMLSGIWENIKTKSSETWEAIKSKLSETWENIKTSVQEKFNAVRDKIKEVWENVKSNTSEKWESIKTSLFATWETIKATATTVFESIKTFIANTWEGIKANTASACEGIKSTLSNTWESIKSNAVSAFDGIKSSISNAWRGITESARNWGSDMGNNIASGIRSAYNTVSNAASGLANNIRSYLHFSEPDKGGLSDFHTYMPDMIDLLVSGIKNNEYKAANAAADLARSISNAMSDVEPVQLQYSSPPSIPYATLPVISAAGDISGMSVRNYSESRISTDNGDVVNALYAVASRLVEAIKENGDRPISIDGRTLMTSVEKAQYERGANIMGGGALF